MNTDIVNEAEVVLIAAYSIDNKNNIEHLGLELLSSSFNQHNISNTIHIVYADTSKNIEVLAKDKIQQSVRMIGITLDYNVANFVDEFTHEIKRQYPEVFIFTGGNYATRLSSAVLEQYSAIDAVLIGESEDTVIDLWNSLQKGKPCNDCSAIAYRDKEGKYIVRERTKQLNLNSLPFANRIMLKKQTGQYARMQTSRGCLGNCSFCTEASMYHIKGLNNVWRGREPQEIIAEMKEIIQNYNIHHFTFTDSSMEDSEDGTKNRLIEFCTLIIKEQLDVYFVSLMRSESFSRPEDIEVLSLMKQAGLVEAYLGVESFYDPTLRIFNKRASLNDHLCAINNMKKLSINYTIGLIMFHPYTTFEEIGENVRYLIEVNQAYRYTSFVNNVALYLDSKLYQRVKKDELLVGHSIDNPMGYRCADDTVEKLRQAVIYATSENRSLHAKAHQLEGHLLYIDRLIAKTQKNNWNGKVALIQTAEEIKALLSDGYVSVFNQMLSYPEEISNESSQRFFCEKIREESLDRMTLQIKSAVKGFIKQNLNTDKTMSFI